MRIVLWLGAVVLVCLGLFWPRYFEAGAPVLRPVAAPDAAPGNATSAQSLLDVSAAELVRPGRLSVDSAPGTLVLRLRSASTPLTPLALVLEGQEQPRTLAVRESSVVKNLPAGNYSVRSAERWWTGTALEFELSASTPERTLELFIEALGPWNGRVVDARDGAPLSSAQFSWLVRGELGDMGYRAELGQGLIDLDQGRFQVACGGFLARQSRLSIEVEGFAPFLSPWLDYDGSHGIDLGDIPLLPSSGLGDRMRGRIVADESGEGLAEVRVCALEPSARQEQLLVQRGEVQGARVLSEFDALTNERGEFGLELSAQQTVRLAAYSPARGLVLSEPVESSQELVVLRMPSRARLRGCVVSTPELLDSGVIQGVSVEVADQQTTLKLDEHGCFELGGLPAGSVRVALQVLEPQTQGQQVLSQACVRTIEVREGECAEIELRYGVDAPLWWLDARVQLPTDAEYATLRAALWEDSDSQPSRFAVIRPNGEFRLEGDVPGPARIFVGGASADGSRCCLWMGELDPYAPPGQALDIDLRFAAVHGRIALSGQPGVRLALELEAVDAHRAWAQAVRDGLSLFSDGQGNFQIHGLLAGRYSIGRIGGPRLQFELAANSPRPLELFVE